jgi:two-component system sensor histidine kinase MtrB
VGFGPAEAQMVFDRFWRADPARARTTGGTGLGLAIALEDARLHNGWLQAWGECGKGSVFRLTVPRTAGEELAGSPLPLGPDEAEPGLELIHSPLSLRVRPSAAGPDLGGPGLADLDFPGPELTSPGLGSARVATSQPAGTQRTGTEPDGPASNGPASNGAASG